jgi:hypothetical protein
MGEVTNGAGPSRPDALGVQGAKIGKTIRSFADAYVYSSRLFFLSSQRPLILFTDNVSTCGTSGCPSLTRILRRQCLLGRVCVVGVQTLVWSS